MALTSATIVYEDLVATVPVDLAGDELWLAPADLARSTGWERKPAGLCRGALCVPIPPAREAEFQRADGYVNLAALARHRGQALVHDDARTVWVFGRETETSAGSARSVASPDFTLPDLDGRSHSLSDARGRKVVLASWASW